MRKHIKDIVGIGCITLVVVIFFARIFIPTQQILITQDLGRSDAWHFSFPTKYALSQALKNRELPLWRADIGDGFPLFAEGQTGALFLPNLFAFTLFPPVTAYALIMAMAIGSLCIGMYLWCRVIGYGIVASVFVGTTSGFFAYPIMQLPHITLLQGLSVMPFLLVVTKLLHSHGPRPWMGIFAALLSQQIVAGFPQATFITLALCTWYLGWLVIQNHNKKSIIFYIVATFVGIGGGAIQLVPSWEFLTQSTFPQGFETQKAAFFSFPLQDLWSLIYPYAIGNPKLGTYPSAFLMPGNIVWENTIYLGFLPLVMLIYVICFHRRHPLILFFGITAALALVFAWGKYSPIYLFYGLWPLNLFRVPSRFIWITALMLIMMAGFGIHRLYKRANRRIVRAVIGSIVMLHIAHLLTLWWNYHLLVPASTWLTPPPFTSKVKNAGRMITIGEQVVQQDHFIKTGWKSPAPYWQFRAGMSPVSNMVWGVSQHGMYAGRFLLRPTVFDDLLNRQSISTTDTHATTSALTQKLLDMFAVHHVVSFLSLTAPNLIPIQSATASGISASLYTNPTALPRAYIVKEATTAATFESAGMRLQDPQFIVGKHVLLESHEIQNMPYLTEFLTPHNQSNEKEFYPAVITQDSHTSVVIATQTPYAALLVLADTYYPGWTATVDGASVPILHANFTQRAVYVPKGNHTVSFTYTPMSVKIGMYISCLFGIITVALMVFPFSFLNHRMHETVPVPVLRRRRSHAR